jgi:hypothetical protein
MSKPTSPADRIGVAFLAAGVATFLAALAFHLLVFPGAQG